MSTEDTIVKCAAVGVGGFILGLRAVRKGFTAGHSVANGVRKVADGIDTASTWGETKCDHGIAYCSAVKAEYEAELATMQAAGVEATVKQKQQKNNSEFVFKPMENTDDVINVTPGAAMA